MSGKTTITSAVIRPGIEKNSLFIETSNGSSGVLFQFDPKNESVVAEKFIGKTLLEADELAETMHV